MPAPLLTLLKHALLKAEAFNIIMGSHPPPAHLAVPLPELAGSSRGEQPQPTEPTPRNNFVCSNATATDAQVQAWRRWVAQHAELLPCPGSNSSCDLYAVLSPCAAAVCMRRTIRSSLALRACGPQADLCIMDHLEGVRGDAPLADADIAELVILLEEQTGLQLRVTVYSPTLPADR